MTALLLKPAKASVGIDESRYRKRAEDQQRHEVHANHFADKQDQRNGQDSEDQCDFEGHWVKRQVGRDTG